MRARCLLLGFLISAGCAKDADVSSPLTLPHLQRASDVIVLIYPEEILTRTDITPALLETGFTRRVTVSAADAEEWQKFLNAFRATVWKPAAVNGDYRWGLQIRSPAGELHRIHIDRKNRVALVDGAPVTVRGGILRWLKRFR